MADVNWTQYRCNICLMLGLAFSAVVAGLVGWLLIKTGLPVFLCVLLFLVVWAVLGYMVDQQCRGLTAEGPAAAAAAVAHPGAAAPVAGAEDAEHAAERAGEERAAAEAAEAERLAAEEAVRKEAAEKAAAEAAEEERRATEEAAAAERRAAEAEKRAAERVASEGAAREAEIARATAAGEEDRDGDGVVEGTFEGTRPEALDAPRGGQADDLKRIKGVGPKLEKLCNELGFWHFDQIANWTADEVAWVDANLQGFRGRVTRDEWVEQAKILAEGGVTEFSKRVDGGDVPSSQ